MKERKFNLQERLVDFAVVIVQFTGKLPNTYAGQHLGGQLLRSGTSPALNYSEAKSAESKSDFLHKMKICLKELRESYTCLIIINNSGICRDNSLVDEILSECNELISIFVSSIMTAMREK